MKSDCVLLGGFLVILGMISALLGASLKDSICVAIGGGLGGIMIIAGIIILVIGFVGGMDE